MRRKRRRGRAHDRRPGQRVHGAAPLVGEPALPRSFLRPSRGTAARAAPAARRGAGHARAGGSEGGVEEMAGELCGWEVEDGADEEGWVGGDHGVGVFGWR